MSETKTKYILNYPFKDYTEHEGINNSSFQSIEKHNRQHYFLAKCFTSTF
jgi:hypothetical protein